MQLTMPNCEKVKDKWCKEKTKNNCGRTGAPGPGAGAGAGGGGGGGELMRIAIISGD